MAAGTSPIFITTLNNGKGLLDTANANRDGTGTIVTLFTAGSNGSKINRLNIKSSAQPAGSNVVWYLYDGSSYYVFDEWVLGTPAAGSTTVASYQESRPYDDLTIPSGWSLRASITVAPTSGKVHVTVLGGDY